MSEFWEIIERNHDPKMDLNRRNLLANLVKVRDSDSIDFCRFWYDCFNKLYTYELWGVAVLVGLVRNSIGCSDDGFQDWRHWVISCGKEAYETALSSPDDLLPLIRSEPEAGNEGIGAVPFTDLQDAKGLDPRAFLADIRHPVHPSGKNWSTIDELKMIHPKTYEWYLANKSCLNE